MESVVESLLGNARCEESSFGRVGSRHQRGQQRHCPAKLRNNAQNRTEFPEEMGSTNPTNVNAWLHTCNVMSKKGLDKGQ